MMPRAPASAGAASPSRSGRLALTIRIPKKPHRTHLRVVRDGKPAYISASTQGMTVSIAGPTHVNDVVGLLPSSGGCSSSLTSTTCTLTIPGLLPCVSAGSCYTATISTYDAISCAPGCTIPPGANELSAAQAVAFRVVSGENNVENLTLGGIPASLSVTPWKPGYLQGDAHALTLYGPGAQKLIVEALDADGNAIVGPGAPAISAHSNTTALLITNPMASAPNLVTLQPATGGSPPVVLAGAAQLQLDAVPDAQSGAATIRRTIPVTIAHAALYVASNNSVNVFYDGNTGTPNVTITSAAFSYVAGIAIDANGTLYVANASGNSIAGFAAGTSGSATPNLTIAGAGTGLDEPFGIAVTPSGTLYVANEEAPAVTEYPASSNGNAAPAITISGGPTGLNGPTGIALDGSGTAYVTNQPVNSITEYAANFSGDALPTAFIFGAASGLNGPSAAAVDGNGTLYVANALTPSVTEYAAGASGNVAPIATLASDDMNGPNGLAIGADGALYVSNETSQAITEYASDGAGPVEHIFLTFVPTAIAVVPAAVPLPVVPAAAHAQTR
jgi:hypothetical protein